MDTVPEAHRPQKDRLQHGGRQRSGAQPHAASPSAASSPHPILHRLSCMPGSQDPRVINPSSSWGPCSASCRAGTFLAWGIWGRMSLLFLTASHSSPSPPHAVKAALALGGDQVLLLLAGSDCPAPWSPRTGVVSDTEHPRCASRSQKALGQWALCGFHCLLPSC